MINKSTGIIPAILTPFDSNDKVYEKGIYNQLDYLKDNGDKLLSPTGKDGSGVFYDISEVITVTDADNNSAPFLRMYRNSASPADADPLARIKFDGRNDNSQDVTYGYIQAFSTDVSDGSEDGTIDHFSIVGGTARSRISLSPSEAVFNEDSQDIDFRVESSGNANMLHVDGGNDGNTSFISGRFTIASSKAFEIRHRVNRTNNTFGHGVANGFAVEIYTDVQLWKVA